MELIRQDGLQVIEGKWDFKYKTRTFIRHPDGRLNPYYDSLHEIPFLPNGTNIDLNIDAMPHDELFGTTAVKDAGAVTNVELSLGDPRLIPPIIMAGYIILAVILLAIAICIYYLVHPPAQTPPCGTEATVIDVSDCLKIIIMPNCDSRAYNACTDEWAEPDWHGWEPPPEWMSYLIIGVIAIGAIIIIPPLLERRKSTNL